MPSSSGSPDFPGSVSTSDHIAPKDLAKFKRSIDDCFRDLRIELKDHFMLMADQVAEDSACYQGRGKEFGTLMDTNVRELQNLIKDRFVGLQQDLRGLRGVPQEQISSRFEERLKRILAQAHISYNAFRDVLSNQNFSADVPGTDKTELSSESNRRVSSAVPLPILTRNSKHTKHTKQSKALPKIPQHSTDSSPKSLSSSPPTSQGSFVKNSASRSRKNSPSSSTSTLPSSRNTLSQLVKSEHSDGEPRSTHNSTSCSEVSSPKSLSTGQFLPCRSSALRVSHKSSSFSQKSDAPFLNSFINGNNASIPKMSSVTEINNSAQAYSALHMGKLQTARNPIEPLEPKRYSMKSNAHLTSKDRLHTQSTSDEYTDDEQKKSKSPTASLFSKLQQSSTSFATSNKSDNARQSSSNRLPYFNTRNGKSGTATNSSHLNRHKTTHFPIELAESLPTPQRGSVSNNAIIRSKDELSIQAAENEGTEDEQSEKSICMKRSRGSLASNSEKCSISPTASRKSLTAQQCLSRQSSNLNGKDEWPSQVSSVIGRESSGKLGGTLHLKRSKRTSASIESPKSSPIARRSSVSNNALLSSSSSNRLLVESMGEERTDDEEPVKSRSSRGSLPSNSKPAVADSRSATTQQSSFNKLANSNGTHTSRPGSSPVESAFKGEVQSRNEPSESDPSPHASRRRAIQTLIQATQRPTGPNRDTGSIESIEKFTKESTETQSTDEEQSQTSGLQVTNIPETFSGSSPDISHSPSMSKLASIKSLLKSADLRSTATKPRSTISVATISKGSIHSSTNAKQSNELNKSYLETNNTGESETEDKGLDESAEVSGDSELEEVGSTDEQSDIADGNNESPADQVTTDEDQQADSVTTEEEESVEERYASENSGEEQPIVRKHRLGASDSEEYNTEMAGQTTDDPTSEDDISTATTNETESDGECNSKAGDQAEYLEEERKIVSV